ncbi:uncharacterized protein LOC110103313 [Dendrobium catenatum]|uniref:uncharacterized protein LOC110103313 n=1 Tax=Dendrobium catenatum TaxID=906689 RepID=UPI00109FBA44|nr:uncharacterized protein LOC110103313 [Dendrobium catenatum]
MEDEFLFLADFNKKSHTYASYQLRRSSKEAEVDQRSRDLVEDARCCRNFRYKSEFNIFISIINCQAKGGGQALNDRCQEAFKSHEMCCWISWIANQNSSDVGYLVDPTRYADPLFLEI